MILRFLNIQGIAGLVAGAALGRPARASERRDPPLAEAERRVRAALPLGAGGLCRHRRQLPRRRRGRRAPPTSPMPGASRPVSTPSTKGLPMISKPALPLLALLLGACASRPPAPQPIPALAERRALPGLSAASGGAAQAAGEDRLPAPDALTATEQAIQLDELIKWVKAQAAIDPNEVRKVPPGSGKSMTNSFSSTLVALALLAMTMGDKDEAGPPQCLHRRGDRDHHHHHGARDARSRRDRARGAAAGAADLRRLHPVVHLRRHLLEQPSPHDADRKARRRARVVVQPRPVVLAQPVSVRDPLGRRARGDQLAGRRVRRLC